MQIDTLVNTDCIRFMSGMPGGSVGLTIADIPYNEIAENTGSVGTARPGLDKGGADIKTFELSEFLPLVDRITSGAIIIFCGLHQIADIYRFFREKKYPVRQLVWHKTNPSVLNADKEYMSAVENAVWTKKPGSYFGGKCVPNVLRFPAGGGGGGGIHPTEKNHELLRQLIIHNSRPGDLVFDPCAGSGSTLLVAGQEGRHYLGCELRKCYYEPAANRLRNSGGYQGLLFDECC